MDQKEKPKKPRIFVSYSHKDNPDKGEGYKWKDEIVKFFSIGDKFEIWTDSQIPLGEKWFEKIQDAIEKADIGLMLISANFLTSEFIKNNEIPQLLEKCQKKNIKVIMIFISRFPEKIAPDWLMSETDSLQGFPNPKEPLDNLEQSTLKDKLSDLVNQVYSEFNIQNNSQDDGRAFSILDECKEKLKTILTLDELKRYVLNLLPYKNITLEDDFDKIVDHIYEYPQQFVCLLKQLDHNLLHKYIEWMKRKQHYTEEDIKNFDCMQIDMKRVKYNLLITIEPKNDSLENTRIEIWDYENSNPNSLQPIYDEILDLTEETNKTLLANKIIDLINYKTSDDNVLLEFFIPQGYDLKIPYWEIEEKIYLQENYKIVIRLFDRLQNWDRYRANCETFWEQYYAKNASKSIEEVKKPILKDQETKIKYPLLKNRPYLCCQVPLSSTKLYEKILKNNACIALTAVNDANIECIVNMNRAIKDKKLQNLIEECYLYGLENECQYYLIWDNPNRLPQRNREKAK